MPFSPAPLFPDRIKPKATRRLAFLFLLDAMREIFRLLSEKGEEEFASLFSPPNQGAVSHLLFYAEKLSSVARIENAEPKRVAETLRNAALAFYTEKIVHARACFGTLRSSLQEGLCRLFFSLFPFFERSRKDENLLLYLLEHREEWNRHLGERSIETLLFSLFPKGPHDLYTTMREKFAERGLEEFFEQKKHLLYFSWDAAPV